MQKLSNNPNIALVHEYLVQYGGAEKVLEALLELFPNAPIYTGMYNPANLSDAINNRVINSPNKSLSSKFQKYFTFLMPLVFENFDLRKFDIVISNGTAWPKGALTTPEQVHISYVNTPPRFLYGYSVESQQKRDTWYFKPAIKIIDHYLRIWDRVAAQRPDVLITNSYETQKRILKFYNRSANVIYPPVDITVKSPVNTTVENYYILLGRLSAYKNFDLVIKAFNGLDMNLVVIGTGIEEQKLRKLGSANITFTGRLSEEAKARYLANCLGLINPVQDEDLGIVPIEAMAYGKPVLAHKSGGHLETIRDGETGQFFSDLSSKGISAACLKFDKKVKSGYFDSNVIKKSVQKFSKERFQKEIFSEISAAWSAHNARAS